MTLKPVKLSITTSARSAGFTTGDAFRNTIELARLAIASHERYWIGASCDGAFASLRPKSHRAHRRRDLFISVGSGGA